MNKDGTGWYYKRGWAWVALALSAGNSMALWYNFLGFNLIFDTIWMFAAVFSPMVIIGSVILGYFDTHKGTYGGESRTAYEANPFFMEMLTLLRVIAEALNLEVDE